MAPVNVSSDGIGIAHLPNQKHKIITNRGANYTIMLCGKFVYHQGKCEHFLIFIVPIGESGSGKSTFVNTVRKRSSRTVERNTNCLFSFHQLFTTSIKDYKEPSKRHEKQLGRTVEIEITKAGNTDW